MTNDQKKTTLKDALKLIGALAIIAPLITVVIQYRESVRQDLDKNFRVLVEKLSSQHTEDRLAAASNLGTFIKKYYFFKDKHYDEAVDVLVNMVSVELDYNVLNAIKESLLKEKKEDILAKLLEVNRNMFIQEYAVKTAKEKRATEYLNKEKEYKDHKGKHDDEMVLDDIKEEVKRKREVYFEREKTYNDLPEHKQASADFISTFLSDTTKDSPVKNLSFFQNSLNAAIIIGANLSKPKIERSTLSASSILESQFNQASITDSFLTFSDLTKSRFVDCAIIASLFDQMPSLKGVSFPASALKDVFFAGSDLTEANFTGTKGLRPEFFYMVKNIDKAEFDIDFEKQLCKELPEISEEKFAQYVNNSELRYYPDKIEQLFKTLDRMKKPSIKKKERDIVEPFNWSNELENLKNICKTKWK